MAAPSKSWIAITDGQVDADSPLDETLLTAIRDNLVHLEEWLGDGYTAAKDHDHDGVNSKSAVLADGAVTNAKLGGGQVSIEFPYKNLTLTTSYVTFASAEIYIPSGITKLYCLIRQNDDGTSQNTIYAKLKIGTTDGTEISWTGGVTAYTSKTLEITPAGGDKGSFATLLLQAKYSGSFAPGLEAHKDSSTEGNFSYIAASYFSDS